MNILGLLRHGPTAWNRVQRIQGIRDLPLDHEAFDPGSWRKIINTHGPWDRVITSPLSRCRETAALLFPGRLLVVETDLCEQDWGQWTGQSIKELRILQPGNIEDQEQLGWDFTPPGGESRRDVLHRVLHAIDRATRRCDGERILIVTHLGVIKILINHLHSSPFLPGHSVPVAKRALHLLEQRGPVLRTLRINIETT
jgi:probable phosphoglycerate mutase